MSEWQPIETAPKDGSDIIAWDGRYVIVSWWTAYGWRDDSQSYPKLTHWMPLPPPPELAIPHPTEGKNT